MHIMTVGFAWFRQDTYYRLIKIFEDGNTFPRSYTQWRVAAERGQKQIERDGHRVIRVDIDPDDFPKWCAEKGYKIDSDARKRYANSVAAEFVKSGL